jgi:phenylalanine-4-hydroxylase
VMRTVYKIDDYQQSYFVIPSFDALLRHTVETDFASIYVALRSEDDLATDALMPSDHIITQGTQDYASGQSMPM